MALRVGVLVAALALCLLCLAGGVDATSVEAQDAQHNGLRDLIVHLLDIHNPLVIPRTPVQLEYSMSLLSIEEVDEKANNLRISVFSGMQWSDHRLQWNPANYSGATFVTLPPGSIWEPDITLLYADVVEKDDINLVAYPDGTVVHFLPFRLAIPCNFDFSDYPFDSHTCDIRLESWTHPSTFINLTLYDLEPASTEYHYNNSKWELQAFKAERRITRYQCCPDLDFIDVWYRIQFKRTVGEYGVRIVAPAVVSSLLILVCFLIPPLAGGRVVLCGLAVLCLLLQLFHLNLTVPISGPNAPFLADFLCFGVFLAFFAAVESVVAMNLCSWGSWSDRSKKDSPKDGEALVESKPNLFLMQLARIIDLVCFVVFTIIFAIGGAIILNPKTE